MKIGILTFHRAENFGAALQVYALQTYLRHEGHDAYVIDYKPLAIDVVYHIFNPSIFMQKKLPSALKAYIKRFIRIKDRMSRKRKYINFRKKFLLTQDNDIFNGQVYDALIVGSDQIWNLNITKGFDDYYFLNIPLKNNPIKISYAASSECNSYPLYQKNRDQLTMLLNNFDHISVREQSLKNELSKYTNNPISVCLDPTFLLTADDYIKIAKRPIETNYILVYHLSNSEAAYNFAQYVSAQENKAVIEIYADYKAIRASKNKQKFNLGPLEILGYIAYADLIITTSFHGLALSLILQKDIRVIDPNNYRQLNLVKSAGIPSHIIYNLQNYQTGLLRYRDIQSNITSLIEESKHYLADALN